MSELKKANLTATVSTNAVTFKWDESYHSHTNVTVIKELFWLTNTIAYNLLQLSQKFKLELDQKVSNSLASLQTVISEKRIFLKELQNKKDSILLLFLKTFGGHANFTSNPFTLNGLKPGTDYLFFSVTYFPEDDFYPRIVLDQCAIIETTCKSK